jgi:DNA invertase Pin-like site-specific DNA recombinase
VIVERTLDGLAAARRAGKKLGRPLGKSAAAPERVVESARSPCTTCRPSVPISPSRQQPTATAVRHRVTKYDVPR